MPRVIRTVGLATALLIPFGVSAHDGPLDSHGCHQHAIVNAYHCHQGPLAGRQFKSKEAMLVALQDDEKQRRPKPQIKVRYQ